VSAQDFRDIIQALGQQFGQYDNQVERWAAHTEALTGRFPGIQGALAASFGAGSTPAQIFTKATERHQHLAAALGQQALPPGDQITAAGYLNLRFYIYLNGFLQACAESLEKVAYNAGLNPSELVEKSYYKPYFFDRVTVSTEEVKAILQADREQLGRLPLDKKGIVQAVRIRKGVVSTLTESYCPAHPWLYPQVARLNALKNSTAPSSIGEIERQLEMILIKLEEFAQD